MAERALRVSFLRRDGDISIQSTSIVSKRAPASAPTGIADPGTGFWLELRDGKRVVYRRLVSAHFEREAEVFGGGPGEPISRVALSLPSQVELALPLPPVDETRGLRLVLTERPTSLAGARDGKSAAGENARASEPAERQHVDVALGDLVDMRQGGE